MTQKIRLVQLKVDRPFVDHATGRFMGPGVHTVDIETGERLAKSGKGVPASLQEAEKEVANRPEAPAGYVYDVQAAFQPPPPADEDPGFLPPPAPATFPDPNAAPAAPAGGQQPVIAGLPNPAASGGQQGQSGGVDFQPGQQLGAGAGAAEAEQDQNPDLLPDEFPGVKVLRENGITRYSDLEGVTRDQLIGFSGIAEKTADNIGIELYKRSNAAAAGQPSQEGQQQQ